MELAQAVTTTEDEVITDDRVFEESLSTLELERYGLRGTKKALENGGQYAQLSVDYMNTQGIKF